MSNLLGVQVGSHYAVLMRSLAVIGACALRPNATLQVAAVIMSKAAVTIHLVSEATASLLDRLDADVFDNAVNSVLLREFLRNRSHVLVVAVRNAQVVGMATGIAYVHPDKPLSLFINEVGVSGRHQALGIGRQLIVAILDWGKAHGCHEAWVATQASSAASRTLYQSTGGLQDSEQAVFYVYPLADGAGDEA
jgi:GNAT superfamily N-acetyltransferase